MWTLAIFAALAVGVFAQQPNAQQAEDQIKASVAMLCRNNNAEDKVTQAQAAVVGFRSCLEGLVNVDTLKKEIEEAKPHGNLDVVFKKYCDKSGQFTSCIRAAATGVQPCVPAAYNVNLDVVTNATTTMLEFLCYKDGDRIALFIAEEGPQCFESKKKEIGACFAESRKSVGDVSSIINLSQQERCDLTKTLGECVVTALEGCENATPANMIEAVIKFIRKSTPCGK